MPPGEDERPPRLSVALVRVLSADKGHMVDAASLKVNSLRDFENRSWSRAWCGASDADGWGIVRSLVTGPASDLGF